MMATLLLSAMLSLLTTTLICSSSGSWLLALANVTKTLHTHVREAIQACKGRVVVNQSRDCFLYK
jgi:hypothetical protein